MNTAYDLVDPANPDNVIAPLLAEIVRLQAENDSLKTNLANALEIADGFQKRNHQLLLSIALSNYKPARKKGGRPRAKRNDEWWSMLVESALLELPKKRRKVSEAIRRIEREVTAIANDRNTQPFPMPKSNTIATYHSRHLRKKVSSKAIDSV